MKLQDLLKDVEIVDIKGNTDVEVNNISTDSRKATDGSAFIAIKGVQVDGHQYIDSAIKSGAKIIIFEEDIDTSKKDVRYIKVKDTADATGKIATHWFGDPSGKLKLVGVTGTNGKTTTATLLYEMFRRLGYKAGLLSTVANYIDGTVYHATHTTPDPLSLN